MDQGRSGVAKKMVRNRPCAQGRLLGRELARLADKAEAERVQQFPNTKVRCRTCAFRLGTVPNGCVTTLMDAVKCAMEQVPFMCHESPGNTEPCMGWVEFANVAQRDPMPTPWEFSE